MTMRSRKLVRLLAGGASSAELLQLARSYQLQKATRSPWEQLVTFCEKRDFGCNMDNVNELTKPENWAPEVIETGRLPRIALKMRINQRGNFVVTWNSNWDKIVFPEDFSRPFWAGEWVQSMHGSPDPCNLMWLPEFCSLIAAASVERNPVAQSLVAATHVRIGELVRAVDEKLSLVAATSVELETENDRVVGITLDEHDETIRLEQAFKWR